jgi:hypothetical protein
MLPCYEGSNALSDKKPGPVEPGFFLPVAPAYLGYLPEHTYQQIDTVRPGRTMRPDTWRARMRAIHLNEDNLWNFYLNMACFWLKP